MEINGYMIERGVILPEAVRLVVALQGLAPLLVIAGLLTLFFRRRRRRARTTESTGQGSPRNRPKPVGLSDRSRNRPVAGAILSVISFAPLVGAALFGAILPCKDEFGSYCKSADPILLLAAGAVATILGLLLVHRKFFSERGARVNKQGAAQGERPITMFTGPPSPSSGKEYRDAIVSRLSPGEQLVSFADCFEPMWWIPDNGSAWTCTGGTWYFLALTNINIRQGTWMFTQHKKGIFKPITIAPIPEIHAMSAIALDDVVRTTDSKIHIDWMIARHMQPLLTGAGIELPKYSGPECVQLALTLINGDGIDGFSPFVEIDQLVKDIDAAKSGALVVKNTTAVADALDQLVPLLNDGILTQEEFDRAKDGFLGATVEVRESSVGLLRQLHSLHKSEVLSESEFNMKKWDILSKDG